MSDSLLQLRPIPRLVYGANGHNIPRSFPIDEVHRARLMLIYFFVAL